MIEEWVVQALTDGEVDCISGHNDADLWVLVWSKVDDTSRWTLT